MNLHERFIQQQNIKPTDLQKMRIYQRFLDKSHRILGLGKITHYLKVGVFSFIVLIIGGASYFTLYNDSGYKIIKNNNGYQIITPQIGTVQADILGKIIKSKGEVSIINNKNNTTITTDFLYEDEYIILEKNSEIEFTVRDNVLAKVIGPAKVGIQYLGTQKGVNNYAINLISGDYVEVVSINKNLVGEKLGRGRTNKDILKKAIKDHIIIKSPEFSVETKQVLGNINILVNKGEDGKRKISNNGSGDIIMKTIVEDEQKFIAIAPHQQVAVNGRVNFVDVDIEKLKKDIKTKKQFTVRYEIKQNDDKSSIGTAMVDATTIADILETIKPPEKKILSPLVLTNFDKIFKPNSLDYNFSQIQKYYIEGNSSAFHIAYNNLIVKLRKGYEIMGFVPPSFIIDENHLLDGANMADILIRNIINTYDIDTSHIVELYVIANKLRTIVDSSKTVTSINTFTAVKKESITEEKVSLEDKNNDDNETLEEQLKELGIK